MPAGPNSPPLVAGDQSGAPDADPLAAQKLGAQQVMTLGNEIDRALLALAGVAKDGSKEIGQARQLIQAGIAKYMAAQGAAGAQSAPPTTTGASFPGGGFGSIR